MLILANTDKKFLRNFFLNNEIIKIGNIGVAKEVLRSEDDTINLSDYVDDFKTNILYKSLEMHSYYLNKKLKKKVEVTYKTDIW